MDRTAVFVDAGYLFAAGSKLISNEKLPRGELNLNYDAVLRLLTGLVADITELPLLRVYWYDGTSTGPTPQQLALAYRPSVKLRLGFVNQQGQQKGVDSLIVTDLINLARNRAMADVLLLTGDEDIRVGVQQAQEFGGCAPARSRPGARKSIGLSGARGRQRSRVDPGRSRDIPESGRSAGDSVAVGYTTGFALKPCLNGCRTRRNQGYRTAHCRTAQP